MEFVLRRKRPRRHPTNQVLACHNCRKRHTRCEQSETDKPCSYCARAGLACEKRDESSIQHRGSASGDGRLTVRGALIQFPDRSETESQTFHRFVVQVAPFLVDIQSSSFWLSAVVPAAHTHSAIFDAALAVEALYSLAMNETLSAEENTVPNRVRKQYQDAIDWYRRSVTSVMSASADEQSLDQVRLLLLTSIAYLHVELRLGHSLNVNGLIRTTFAVLHAAKSVLWTCMDQAILQGLSLLLALPVVLSINSKIVIKEHRSFAIILALKLSSELDFSKFHLLRFELLSMMYDLNDIICGDAGLEVDLDFRLKDWYARYQSYESLVKPFDRKALTVLHCLYMGSQVQWQAHQFGIYGQRNTFEHRLSYILGVVEQVATNSTPSSNSSPSGILDSLIMPYCIFIMWYWRDHPVFMRIRALLQNIQGQSELKDLLLEYLGVLLTTGYEAPTIMELELFGGKPRVLQMWQVQRCSQLLAQRARLSMIHD